jgi:hypothetical protein
VRGLFREFRIAKQRLADTRDQAMSLAWHMAALQRAEKLPVLKSLLSKPEKPERQTVAQLGAVMQQLSAQLGIPIRRTRLIKREV